MGARGKVLIRTFPPNRNPNPGGILQAWALQRVLEGLGAEPVTDGTKTNLRSLSLSPASRPPTFFHRLWRSFAAKVSPASERKRTAAIADRRDAVAKVNGRVLSFARREIHQRRLYSGRVADPELIAWPDAFVAGSDQIWNPRYCDVPSFLFDFVSEDDRRPRVIYGGSFGSDDPGFTPELISETVELARRLTSVSVREESAVRLCRAYWGIEAIRVIDPTMLLDPEDYRAAYENGGHAPLPSGGLAVYVLDPTDAARSTTHRLSCVYGEIAKLWAPEPPGVEELRRQPDTYRRPTIEEWLNTIAVSDAVLTDSYHGAVFSILFNRPFLVFPNPTRGVARFDTLLSVFGLEERIARGDEQDLQRMAASIDWKRVNEIIVSEKTRGIDYLRDSLAPVLSSGAEVEPTVHATGLGGMQ